MTNGTKLSEFEKGDITGLKRVGKSQREISKALGRRKTVICNYLKSPNKYGTRKLTGLKNHHHNSREKLFMKQKRKLHQHQK